MLVEITTPRQKLFFTQHVSFAGILRGDQARSHACHHFRFTHRCPATDAIRRQIGRSNGTPRWMENGGRFIGYVGYHNTLIHLLNYNQVIMGQIV